METLQELISRINLKGKPIKQTQYKARFYHNTTYINLKKRDDCSDCDCGTDDCNSDCIWQQPQTYSSSNCEHDCDCSDCDCTESNDCHCTSNNCDD